MNNNSTAYNPCNLCGIDDPKTQCGNKACSAHPDRKKKLSNWTRSGITGHLRAYSEGGQVYVVR